MNRFLFTLSQASLAPGAIPDWIQLTPVGVFSGADGRGPFVLEDMVAVIAASMPNGKPLAIDINHAIDLKGSAGEPSPAVGWIVELQARHDGIWGRVEWTARGREIVAAKEYGFISPVLMTTLDDPAQVISIERASLCNDPNLTQLKSLHLKQGESIMDKELRAALGLPEDAKDDAVLAAAKAAAEAQKTGASLMTKLREVGGLETQADDEKIIATFTEKFAAAIKETGSVAPAAAEKVAMEQQIAALNARLLEVTQTQAREKAEAFVNKAIANFQIVPALKEHFIARHMKEPALVEKEIAAMPALMSAGLKDYQPDGNNKDGVSADERRLCHLMGVDVKQFAEAKAQEKELV